MKEKFEKITQITPAYDKRNPDSKKNYGIGAMRIRFVLNGKKGAVQALFSTKIYLHETVKEYKQIGNKNQTTPCDLTDGKMFDCGDVGYHSPRPFYSNQQKMDCDILPKGYCYYDGSSLRGNEMDLPDRLMREGSDAIWSYLETYYNDVFGSR